MKAITLKKHGGIDQVKYANLAVPDHKTDEVLIEVKAAALNRLDLWVIEGWPGLHLQFPHIMGCDGSGVIAAVGKNVNEFEVGDRVAVNPTLSCDTCEYCRSGQDNMCDRFAIFGEHVPGFFAEYQAVPARNLLKLPPGISFELAAAASLVYVTAWHSLIDIGNLRAGEDILIVGAAGGANSAYLDIARLAGARRIYVVGSNPEKLDHARKLGAHITINRNEVNWGKAIYELTNRRGVDLVVDNVGAATYTMSLRSLCKGGRLLTIGNTSGAKFEFDNRYIFAKHLRIIGTTMGPRQAYNKVMNLVFNGQLNPVIDTVYPMDDGLTALRRLESGNVIGKLVLAP